MTGEKQRRRTKGTGSLVEARPGVWRLRVFVNRDPVTGRPVQINRTVRTKARGGKTEAQAELTKLIREVDEGRHKGTDATFGTLLTAWLKHLEDQGKAPSTLATYRIHVEKRIRPALGGLKVRKIQPYDLDQFYATQREAGLGVATVKLVHSICSAALQQGVDWGWIPKNPARTASPPVDIREQAAALTPVQVQELISAAQKEGDVDLAMAILLGAWTGARRGELCGLRWSDIDWEARTLQIVRARVPVQGHGITEGKPKTGTRILGIDPALVERLRAYRQLVGSRKTSEVPADPWLLTPDDGTTAYSPKALSAQITALGKKLGIPAHTHALRHFAVTQLVGAGVDPTTASTQLGHSVATMLGTYSHPVMDRQQAASAILGAALLPKPSP